MNQIEVLLTPHQWLTIPHLIRLKLAADFKLVKSTGSLITTKGGYSVIESDGHTVNDLRGINVISMQEYLGFTEPNPDEDFFALLHMVVDKAEKALEPTEQAPAQENAPTATTEPSIPMPEKSGQELGKELADTVKRAEERIASPSPYCDSCTSKGPRHLKVCPKSKKTA